MIEKLKHYMWPLIIAIAAVLEVNLGLVREIVDAFGLHHGLIPLIKLFAVILSVARLKESMPSKAKLHSRGYVKK